MNRNSIDLLAIIGLATLLFVPSPAFAQVPLGSSESFAILGGSTVTNIGPSNISGDVGVSPGTSVTGFPPGLVSGGAIHLDDALAAQAQADLATAYSAAAGTACNVDLTGQDLGGLTLTPDVYCFSLSASLNGTLTLNFQGDPNALFIFKTGSTLTTAGGSAVVLANNGGLTCPPNLYWQVGNSVTLGPGSTFAGSILALNSITMNSGTTLNGRALSQSAAITLDTSTVTACAPAFVCPTITVNPATLPAGAVGTAYSATVSANGGAPPYTFAVTSGALPAGLALNGATGAVTGVPTATGASSFTITASDTSSCLGSRVYAVTASCPAITVNPATLPDGAVGTAYSATVSASGGAPPYTFAVTSSVLPVGLVLNGATGDITGVPTATGTSSFTITASDTSSCLGSRTYAVTVSGPPAVVVSANPSPLFAEAGTAGASASFVIANLGGTATTVTLTRSGNFFSLAPSGVTLAPGASESITITSLSQPIGAYSGATGLMGEGVPSGLSVPVSLIVYGPPGAAIPDIEPVQVRVDVEGQGPIITGGLVGFRNAGAAAAIGVVVSEAPWLIPQGTPVTIAPGQVGVIGFSINRAFRANPGSVESLLTTVRFVYPPVQPAAANRGPNTTSAGVSTQPGTQASDSPDLAAAISGLPDIAPGQIGLTIPGVRSVSIPSGRILTELLVSSTATDRGFGLYLLEKDAPGSAAIRAGNASSVSATEPLRLADVVDKGFHKPSATGSLHFRSSVSSSLSVDALIQVLDDARQLLVFRDSPSARSDRGAGPGAALYLPGVAGFASAAAVIYVQEVAGAATEVEIQLLDASGAVLQTFPRRTVERFQMVEQQIAALGGVATIAIRNAGASGRITAVGEESAATALDARSLWDSGSIYGNRRDEALAIPYAASSGGTPPPPVRHRPVRRPGGSSKSLIAEAGGAMATQLALFSPGGARLELELRTATRTATSEVVLEAGQTRSFDNAFVELFSSTASETGAIVLRPLAGEFVAAAWLVDAGVAGETVVVTLPVLPLTSALGARTEKTFLNVSDSSATSISSKVAAAVTPTLGLVETSGSAVTVDVVVSYAVVRATAAPFQTRRYSLAANQVLQIEDVVRTFFGAARDTAPDLFNVTISVKVVSGTGKVIPFLVTRALRSGDRTIRVR